MLNAGDKEGIARSDDLGRDLSSVQTLFTKQVRPKSLVVLKGRFVIDIRVVFIRK